MDRINTDSIAIGSPHSGNNFAPQNCTSTLLIVDDEPDILSSLKRALAREDYIVLTATTGEIALELLQENFVNVVLSDLRMPHMSGVQFLELVKDRYPDIIRILISAYGDIPTMRDAINQGGVYKILEKPWSNENLLSTIKTAFITHKLQQENQLLTEQLIRANDELESKNDELKVALNQAKEATKSKSEFLANMSHEIRTPIYGVMGMLDLLEDTHLNSNQHTYTRTAQSSAEILLTIIDDILDFSKIEAGKLFLENIDFDIHQVVEDSVIMLAERAQKKDLELLPVIAPNIPQRVRGDPVRIKQIITNLLSNAVKFTESGEVIFRISLEASEVDKIGLKMEVQDTGIGISEESQKKLFQSFTQSDNSTTRKYGGTGLGLTICKQLSELMNGKIGVSSTLGEGTTFQCTVFLEKPVEKVDTLYHQLGESKVLIVESNKTLGNTLKEYFIQWGLNVFTAKDTSSALNELIEAAKNNQPYNVVVAEHNKEKSLTLEFSKTIIAEPNLAAIKIVILHPMNQKQFPEEGIVEAFISKPIRISALYNTLATCLDKHSLVVADYQNNSKKNKPQYVGNVLLVEDNELNQEVGLQLLRKQGLQASLAKNGQEAVSMASECSYDIIFMDCQMPIMNGFDASTTIRHQEIQSSRKRTPIVALTANVMRGDKEKCTAAGMDDFLTKPFRIEILHAILSRWLLNESSPQLNEIEDSNSINKISSEEKLTLDINVLDQLNILAAERFVSMAKNFSERSKSQLNILNDAIAAGNSTKILEVAHGLKGAAAQMGAEHLADLCLKLEQALDERQSDLTPYIHVLEQEYQKMHKSLENYLLQINKKH